LASLTVPLSPIITPALLYPIFSFRIKAGAETACLLFVSEGQDVELDLNKAEAQEIIRLLSTYI